MGENLILSCAFKKWRKHLLDAVGQAVAKMLRYKWKEINTETYSGIIDINNYTHSLIM